MKNNEDVLEKKDTEHMEDGQKIVKYRPLRNYEIIWQSNNCGIDERGLWKMNAACALKGREDIIHVQIPFGFMPPVSDYGTVNG